jgi:isopentenyl-diphosphate delta-isomerase
VGWADFSADVLEGSRDVSTWCREQVPQLVALGSDPRRWPVADDRLLPPAAHV